MRYLLFLSLFAILPTFTMSSAAYADDDDSASEVSNEDLASAVKDVGTSIQALKGLKGKALAAGIMAMLAALFSLLRLAAKRFGAKVFKNEKALDTLMLVLGVLAAVPPIISGLISGSVDWVSAVILLLSGPVAVVIAKVQKKK